MENNNKKKLEQNIKYPCPNVCVCVSVNVWFPIEYINQTKKSQEKKLQNRKQKNL